MLRLLSHLQFTILVEPFSDFVGIIESDPATPVLQDREGAAEMIWSPLDSEDIILMGAKGEVGLTNGDWDWGRRS